MYAGEQAPKTTPALYLYIHARRRLRIAPLPHGKDISFSVSYAPVRVKRDMIKARPQHKIIECLMRRCRYLGGAYIDEQLLQVVGFNVFLYIPVAGAQGHFLGTPTAGYKARPLFHKAYIAF